LLQDLDPLFGSYPVPYLNAILVLPHPDIAAKANSLILEATGQEGTYQSAPTDAARAIALPIEVDGELRCYILIAHELAENLTTEKHHPAETVSALLEEFLHVWIYGLTWDRCGFLQPKMNTEDPCQQQLMVLLRQAFDEYCVMRTKAALLDKFHLVDAEGGFRQQRILYGGNVTSSMQAAERELRDCVLDVAIKKIPVSQVGPRFFTTLYRGILEPLSRNAAPLDAYEDLERKDYLPETQFFRRIVAPYWKDIHVQLRRAYEHPEQTEHAAETSFQVIKAFLMSIGVTLRKGNEGQCYIWFDATFFLAHSHLIA
jgi:hypothetical protein